jgi:hypothetical protein
VIGGLFTFVRGYKSSSLFFRDASLDQATKHPEQRMFCSSRHHLPAQLQANNQVLSRKFI